MSEPMFFNPSPEQIAESRASTCRLATPKDPRGCERTSACCHKKHGQGANVQCHNYRPLPDQATKQQG